MAETKEEKKILSRLNMLIASYRAKYKKWPNRMYISADIYTILSQSKHYIHNTSSKSKGEIFGISIFIKKGKDYIEVSRILGLREDSI